MNSFAVFKSLLRTVSRFHGDAGGSIAVLVGILFPLILGGSLFSIDHVRATNQVAALQKAADAAALLSARQMSFVLIDTPEELKRSDSESEVLTAIASGVVGSTLRNAYPDITISALIMGETRVKVVLTAPYQSLFGEMGFFGENPFTVEATAETYGSENICLIAVGPDPTIPAIEMDNDATLNSDNCGIYSGSMALDGIQLRQSARITSTLVCSAGGFDGNGNNVSVAVTTDCPKLENPLKDRPNPNGGGCDHTDLTMDGGSHTLEPGVYCGRTDIRGGADVWLNPGIYVFRDGGADGNGELQTHDTSSLKGTGVGLHFKDLKSRFRFLDDSEIDLSAPTGGTMAGILISSVLWCDDGIIDYTNTIVCPSNKIHEISSSKVRSLLGTLYLAWDELLVETTMPVSSEAAFTIIVIGKLTLKDSPTLVLNTDYAATNVPVPEGFEADIMVESRLVR